MGTFVFDDATYEIVQDGRVYVVDDRAYAIQDVETGECFPGLLAWFRTIQQWYRGM